LSVNIFHLLRRAQNPHPFWNNAACKGSPVKSQTGFSLLELLAALGIFSLIAIVYVQALQSNTTILRVGDEHTTARNLAATIVETVRNENFSANYSSVTDNISVPLQYDVSIEYKYSDDGGDTWTDNFSIISLQRITVFISRDGKAVMNICDYRMDL